METLTLGRVSTACDLRGGKWWAHVNLNLVGVNYYPGNEKYPGRGIKAKQDLTKFEQPHG